MDKSRTYSTSTRFDPPEEGILPGETILWTRRAGFGFWIIFFGMMILTGGPFLFIDGFELGLTFSSVVLLLDK